MSNPNLEGWKIDDLDANGWWFDRDRVWHVHVPIVHADGSKASLLLEVTKGMMDNFCYGMEEILNEETTIDDLVAQNDAVFSEDVDR